MDSALRQRNLRDLGGLRTRTGFVVAPGRLFRSSDPSRFDAAECRALAALNLRSIVDLRTTAERGQSKQGAVIHDVRVVQLPLFGNARPNWTTPIDQSPPATALRYFEMLQEGLDTLAAVVALLAQPSSSPTLICCTAGRDRTGIVVACLLDLLDVAENAIEADYAQSDSFDPGSGRAHAATILELLRLVRHHYGSTLRMLGPAGISEDVVGNLRTALI